MDLYEILELQPKSSKDDITKAYRRLAKKYHPDKPNGSTEKFQEINYAYNILICDKTKLEYDSMKKPMKNKFVKFIQEWFKKQDNIKNFLNLNEINITNIMDNIEIYNFQDILNLFNKMVIPNKKDNSLNCSDSDTLCWDDCYAEYYNINNLPLKYIKYNENNIKINLKCSLDDIINNTCRKIKVKRKINDTFIETYFSFNCSHNYIVFNNGGDNDGHLIITLNLPDNYLWLSDTILHVIDITLYQFIYGISIEEYKINNYLPYIDGNIINIKIINNYIFGIKLNIIYNHTEDNKIMLESIK
jgi:hypothetical protein